LIKAPIHKEVRACDGLFDRQLLISHRYASISEGHSTIPQDTKFYHITNKKREHEVPRPGLKSSGCEGGHSSDYVGIDKYHINTYIKRQHSQSCSTEAK
jgi:hypothetical protein